MPNLSMVMSLSSLRCNHLLTLQLLVWVFAVCSAFHTTSLPFVCHHSPRPSSANQRSAAFHRPLLQRLQGTPADSDGKSEQLDDDDTKADQEGADLAAAFFKMVKEKGIDEVSAVEDDEEEEEDEGADDDIPESALLGFRESSARNVSLTNDQIYAAVKDRALDTAGGFVEMVREASEDDDDEEEPKAYEPPKKIPDPELTAGDVVMLVLEALLNNDVPTKNRGVEILFGFSSPGSQIKNEATLSVGEYAAYLKETEYSVLFDHQGASIDKVDYAHDGKKAFLTALLRVGSGPLDVVPVNFILWSPDREEEDEACWMVDSMLIRPQAMRRRRRR